jgi:hypothetical protein
LLGDVNKLFVFKTFLTTPSNVLLLHLKQTFLHIIWIFTEGEGDGIKSRLPLKKILLYSFDQPNVNPHSILITQFSRQLKKKQPERNLNLFYNSRFQLLTKWLRPNPIRKNGFQLKNIIFATINNYGSKSLWYYCESRKDCAEKRGWNYFFQF